MVDATKLQSQPQVANTPDWTPPPEHKENQTLLKIEPKEFLNQWTKSFSNVGPAAECQLTLLLKYLYLARQKKMVQFTDTHIQLLKQHQDHLNTLRGTPLMISFNDLEALIKSPDTQLVLDSFQIIEAANWSEPIHSFEYRFAYLFIRDCMVTTFPDYRQKFMKSLHQFFIRLRTIHYKDIKKNKPVPQLEDFLRKVIDHCQLNLYLDKPIEGSFPLFDVLKITQELFGGIEYHLNKNKIFEPVNYLQKQSLLESRSLFNFLVNSLKSSWANVRRTAFDLLTRYADTYQAFGDDTFVNQLLVPTALDYANDPRAMMAEAAALMLKLAFLKCTDVLVLNGKKIQGNKSAQRLALLQFVLQIVKERLKTFTTKLISQGQTTALIHGHIAFFKHIFSDFNLDQKSLQPDDLQHWRSFFNELLQTTLEISKVCSGLLSNNRLTDEGTELVDSRGHPIVQEKDLQNIKEQGDQKFEDYENLILVGIWLAVKENGETLQNLLKWAHLPQNPQDQTSFLEYNGVETLCENFLEMLFQFKHRGAIEITADTFEIFVGRLLVVPQFSHLPKKMLDKTLDRISKESHSTVLRRSAGIPPTIIAILRAEPGIIKANRSWNKKKGVEKRTEETVLLNTTLTFLLNLARDAKQADSRIHALNIMKFIFQDTYLREDITQFITPAMILSCDEFQNENWNIRNSALMCFTALIKRLLGTHHIQDQDLSRRKGLSAIDLHKDFQVLLEYFTQKLGLQTVEKKDKDKQDMVNFSIMLLLSRLVPFSFFSVQDAKKEHINPNFTKSVNGILDLIKKQSGNSTYFVRKISAQSLLPLLEFDQWLPEIFQCLEQFQTQKLKQNQAHGLMLRVNVFLAAYFKYRQIAVEETEENKAMFREQELKLQEGLVQFLQKLDCMKRYNRMIWGLFVQSFRLILTESACSQDTVKILNQEFEKKMQEFFEEAGQNLTHEFQSYFEELLKTRIEILTKLGDDTTLVDMLIKITGLFNEKNIDMTYVFMQSYQSKLKFIKNKDKLKELCEFNLDLVCKFVEADEQPVPNKNAKVLEMGLKCLYKSWKHLIKDFQWKNHAEFRDRLVQTLELVSEKFPSNDIFKAQVIKLQTLAARFYVKDGDNFQSIEDQMTVVADLILENVYMTQKEQVRIVSAQSFSTLITLISEKNLKQNLFFRSASLYESYLKLMRALVYILTDENPQIRLFIQNQSILEMLGMQFQLKTVQTELVDANDIVLLQQLFKRITSQMLSFKEGKLSDNQISNSDLEEIKKEKGTYTAIPESDYFLTEQQVKFLFTNEFLLKFIEENPYREHLSMNFDDKIFFHEPENKFFDLPMVRTLAWEQLNRIPTSPYDNRNLKKQVDYENQVVGMLMRCYCKSNELRRTSTEFEEMMSKVIYTVSNKHCTQAFKDIVGENQRIEHIIKNLTL